MGYAPEMCIVCAQEIEDRGSKEGGVGEEEGECVGGLVLGGGLLRGICRHGWCTGGAARSRGYGEVLLRVERTKRGGAIHNK